MLLAAGLAAQPMPTELYLRGYSVIPTPRKVKLLSGDVALDESWRLEAADHIAARTLVRGPGPFLIGGRVESELGVESLVANRVICVPGHRAADDSLGAPARIAC